MKTAEPELLAAADPQIYRRGSESVTVRERRRAEGDVTCIVGALELRLPEDEKRRRGPQGRRRVTVALGRGRCPSPPSSERARAREERRESVGQREDEMI